MRKQPLHPVILIDDQLTHSLIPIIARMMNQTSCLYVFGWFCNYPIFLERRFITSKGFGRSAGNRLDPPEQQGAAVGRLPGKSPPKEETQNRPGLQRALICIGGWREEGIGE